MAKSDRPSGADLHHVLILCTACPQVLSSAWKPNPKKSAEWRTHFQKAVHRVRDWDTRSPVYEKKQSYDALWDANCRRVVEDPHFKTMLLRTRPDSQHLLDHRIIDEEKQKVPPSTLTRRL